MFHSKYRRKILLRQLTLDSPCYLHEDINTDSDTRVFFSDENDTFMCNGRCLSLNLRCDGKDDCGDNTDEQNCRVLPN